MTDDTKNLPAEVAEQSPGAIAKAGMAPGGALGALAPQSLDDAFRLSKALARAGDMVPKHFQGKPDMIMAAVVRGMEIGLAPMQALSNIAVINGRASIWGDVLPAMMQRAGHQIDTEISGEGDKMVATATLTRGDTGQRIVRSFSVEDAKKANLWGKQGPWQSYPKRMLTMRARSWAVRDGAADALMGLQIAEEVQDYQPMRDVTPKPGGFAQMAAEARGAPDPQKEQDAAPDEAEAATDGIEDAEPAYDDDAVDVFSNAYDDGLTAQRNGEGEGNNPYETGSVEWNNFIGGWRFAESKKEKVDG